MKTVWGMCVFDYSKILKRMAVMKITIDQVAIKMGISERAFIFKLKSIEEFTSEEIDLFALGILNIRPEEIPEYFFLPKSLEC